MDDDQVNAVMERIRARQIQLSASAIETIDETKENVVEDIKPSITAAPRTFGSPSKINIIQAAKPKEESPIKNEITPKPEQTSARKARFSALAAELDDFECDYQNQYNKPKEAYMKGRSPRMSIGETRPSVLCTPAGNASMRSPNIAATKSATNIKIEPQSSPRNVEIVREETKSIKFAHPIVNVNYLPNESSLLSGRSSVNDSVSTVLGGSAEMMNVTTSSLSTTTDLSINHHITVENTLINAQSCENRDAIIRERTMALNDMTNEEYGAHTFMRKKPTLPIQQEVEEANTPTKQSIHVLVSSPKPFSKQVANTKFSPVHFTPQSTSSPLPKSSKSEPCTVLSPAKTAALENACARVRRQELEERIRGEKNKGQSPGFSSRQPIVNTPHVHLTPHQKNLFSKKDEEEKTTSTSKIPGRVQTQWRGQHNTPVVQGARADEKTAGSDVFGAGVSKLKNLKSRWEFSSATGTPIHPDASEDSLIATAIKMKETSIPQKIGASRNLGKSIETKCSTTSIGSQNKQQYVAEEEDFLNKNEEEPFVQEDDVSEDEIASTDASRIIDQAFDFMDRGSKMGGATPSPYRPSAAPAPLAQFDESPIKQKIDVIEEEENVPMGIDENEEEEEIVAAGDNTTQQHIDIIEETWSERKNDSRLPYTVSFYRKIQKEHNAKSDFTPIQPSAPPCSSNANIGSPKMLRGLTDESISAGMAGRIVETEIHAKERIKKAIKIEDEHISQAKRAIGMCRQTPRFRGSREEVELQRALLVAIEKQRALLSEFERLKRDGPIIYDGPRGRVEIGTLEVSISREFLQQCLTAVMKPADLYYFVAVLKCGEQVEVTQLQTSDDAINKNGTLEFASSLKLSQLPSDFKAVVEFYGQKCQRELITHEVKFNLGKGTLKTKNVEKWCFYVDKGEEQRILEEQKKQKKMKKKHFWNMLHTDKNATLPSSSYYSSDTSFRLLGSFEFDVGTLDKNEYQLSHAIFPLDGRARMKRVTKRAIEGSDVEHRGFLSMYQRTKEGLGSWTRYWCVLSEGQMKFWRHPEDERSKSLLVSIDLATCIGRDGASTVNDVCPYPNSFHIGVWVSKEAYSNETITSINQIEKLRVMLAADTPSDLQKWLSAINCCSRQLYVWRYPMF